MPHPPMLVTLPNRQASGSRAINLELGPQAHRLLQALVDKELGTLDGLANRAVVGYGVIMAAVDTLRRDGTATTLELSIGGGQHRWVSVRPAADMVQPAQLEITRPEGTPTLQLIRFNRLGSIWLDRCCREENLNASTLVSRAITLFAELEEAFMDMGTRSLWLCTVALPEGSRFGLSISRRAHHVVQK